MMLARKYIWVGIDRLQFGLIPNDRINRGFQRLWNSAYARFYYKRRTPEIKVVGIQTITGCNYSCSFCPANKSDELYGGVGKTECEMKTETFSKIMNDLRAMNFRGTIALFMMNEPLLDDRIVTLTSLARLSNPHARLQIDTNGSLLDSELLKDLFDAGLDLLVVNDYTKDHRVLEKFRRGEMGLPRGKCRLVSRSSEEPQDARGHKITNRAGNVPRFAIPDVPLKLFCERPFNHMYVGYSGKVVVCCQDWEFEGILGDVMNGDSLAGIWEGAEYSYVREKLLKQDREMRVCCMCDFMGMEPQ